MSNAPIRFTNYSLRILSNKHTRKNIGVVKTALRDFLCAKSDHQNTVSVIALFQKQIIDPMIVSGKDVEAAVPYARLLNYLLQNPQNALLSMSLLFMALPNKLPPNPDIDKFMKKDEFIYFFASQLIFSRCALEEDELRPLSQAQYQFQFEYLLKKLTDNELKALIEKANKSAFDKLFIICMHSAPADVHNLLLAHCDFSSTTALI